MSNAVIGCTVLIDGVAISDGCSSLDPDVPAVLSGLRITWGRSTTVDQPVASSCVFGVLDPLTGTRLVPSLTIGRPIDVRADTVIYPDPDVSTIPVLIPSSMANVTRATVAPAGTVTAVADGSGRQMSMIFPPLAYTSNPLGWDSVPRTLPGQEWRYRATVTPPAPFAGYTAWAAQVRPVTFTKPDGSDVLLLEPVTAAPTVDVTFTPPPGVWLGLQVAAYPTSPAWADLDSTAWADLAATPTWEDLGTFVITAVELLAPAEGAADSAMVFSGRITDVIAQWDGGDDATLQVIAQDWLAELANRYVGDQPWAAENLAARAQRIVQLSGQPVTLTVDPAPAALQVTYRDVDRQPAAGLLQQLATSGGSVLWTATHIVTGQIMRIEDVAARPAALTLTTDGTNLVHVIPSPGAAANALPITACDIDAEPVRFLLDTTDTISLVALTWLEQVVDPDTSAIKPTQRTVEVTAPETLAAIGARRMSVSTQLITETDATNQANSWLARGSVMAWRIEGLTWDTYGDLSPTEVTAAMRLIDGTRRNGLPITLTDLPEWVGPMTGGQQQVALYVEGGDYQYRAGSWELAINTSSANGSAVGNLPWVNLETAWRWLDFDPGVTWLDLYGVTYPAA